MDKDTISPETVKEVIRSLQEDSETLERFGAELLRESQEKSEVAEILVRLIAEQQDGITS
jgi:hypothetical protein